MTLLLILFSYTLNHMRIGAVIMLIHDFTDIIISIFKLVIDTTSNKVQYSMYAFTVLSWIFYRIYFFPVLIIKTYYEQTV